jgi:ABC-2 type transport system permease protein
MNAAVLRAAHGVFMRDLLTFASYRGAFVTQLLSLFLSLTLFYYISRLVQFETFASPDAYYAFAVVGLVTLQLVNSTLDSPPNALRGELVAGTFERFLVSPLGPARGLVAMMLFPFASSLVTGAAMIAFAGLAFGLELRWETAALAIPVAALAAFAFAAFGLVLVAATVIVKQTTGGVTWVIAGLSVLAGLYFPVAVLPDWIEWTAHVQPFTPAVDLMRNVLVGVPLGQPAWVAVAKIAGFAVLLLPLAAWLLTVALRAARRRGTILEY